jgi:Fur family ferric uptake transcriptional regulator
MEKNGYIQSFGTDENKEICYRYIGPGDCQNKIHLICRKCGKFFHLEGDALQKIKKSILKECDFYVNQQESCLFGYCSRCYQKENPQAK